MQSANALTKAIKQNQSALPITHMGEIEGFESIIDIFISRNYLEMREYSTTM